MGVDSKPIDSFLIEKTYGVPCLRVDEYEKLANKNKEPKKAVLNLNWDVGTHWVGVKTEKDGIIKYYDPFGVSPPFKDLNRIVKFNTIKDQELEESNCGWRVLFWLLNN